jgi:hypothetical protein
VTLGSVEKSSEVREDYGDVEFFAEWRIRLRSGLYRAIGGDMGVQTFLKLRHGGVEIENFGGERLGFGERFGAVEALVVLAAYG